MLLKFTKPYPIVERFKDEDTFHDPITKSRKKFYQLEKPPTVNLSVIVPAYNEEERCKRTIISFVLDYKHDKQR